MPREHPRRRQRDRRHDDTGEPVRLQVYLARAGVASRRASEALIREGRVEVDGKTTTEMGSRVVPGRSRVTVDGRAIELNPVVWIALHKPRGYVTTRDDPRGRRTVYDLLPDHLHHLFHVGRLDRQSTGLLLMTNDGDAANRLMHPRYGTTREYDVDVEGVPDSRDLDRLVEGVELEDGRARADDLRVLRMLPRGWTRVRIALREGRNREVRRMFDAIGYPVQRLRRRRFGPVQLGKLAPGRWRTLTPDEVESLRSSGSNTNHLR